MPTPPLDNADLIASFPDNHVGAIHPSNMRDFVNSVPLLVNNLSDLPNKATALTNLGVYSIGQVNSALAGKLALSGGTMTGPLNGTSANFSGTISANGIDSTAVINAEVGIELSGSAITDTGAAVYGQGTFRGNFDANGGTVNLGGGLIETGDQSQWGAPADPNTRAGWMAITVNGTNAFVPYYE